MNSATSEDWAELRAAVKEIDEHIVRTQREDLPDIVRDRRPVLGKIQDWSGGMGPRYGRPALDFDGAVWEVADQLLRERGQS